MNWLYSLLALLSGLAIGVQAPINGGLGKRVGAMEGALVSFILGTVALFLLTVFFGKGSITSLTAVPKWQLTGGLLGALYVTLSVITVPKLGTATALTAGIIGQLLMGSIIDHYGLFGGKQIDFDVKRLLALLLMAGGLFLFYKK